MIRDGKMSLCSSCGMEALVAAKFTCAQPVSVAFKATGKGAFHAVQCSRDELETEE